MRPRLLAQLLQDHHAALRDGWTAAHSRYADARDRVLGTEAVAADCRGFLDLLTQALAACAEADDAPDIQAAPFRPLLELLDRISRQRQAKGVSPTRTAMFVFALKRPLFAAVHDACGGDSGRLFAGLAAASELLDALGLYTTEVFQGAREAVISQQQNDMLELSTPVVTLWDGILALPLIGTLDSHRTQVVMETLLQRIVETDAQVAIVDITGVPTVDTLVAQHLIKTVTAAQLMGVQCIVSGIRPHIAQTIVHLGVDLGEVITQATLAGAFKVALRRLDRGQTLAALTQTA